MYIYIYTVDVGCRHGAVSTHYLSQPLQLRKLFADKKREQGQIRSQGVDKKEGKQHHSEGVHVRGFPPLLPLGPCMYPRGDI